MTTRMRSRLALVAAGVMLVTPLGWGASEPEQPESSPPAKAPSKARPKAEQDRERGDGAQAERRTRMRERLTRFLNEMREEQKKLEEAISKLEAGANMDDVRDALPERFASRIRGPGEGTGEPDGGPGPRRPGDRGPRAEQPFSEQDWEAVNAIIKHAQPEMLERFDELRKRDPDVAQRRMMAAYPRLRPLLEAYKHDRPGFDLRLEELVIIRKSLPLAKEIIELRRQGKTEESEEMKAARSKLRELAQRHFENRMKIMAHELEQMRQRLARREKELADQSANPERGVERSIEGLIRQAERGQGDAENPPPERRGDGDRPRRRPDN